MRLTPKYVCTLHTQTLVCVKLCVCVYVQLYVLAGMGRLSWSHHLGLVLCEIVFAYILV